MAKIGKCSVLVLESLEYVECHISHFQIRRK